MQLPPREGTTVEAGERMGVAGAVQDEQRDTKNLPSLFGKKYIQYICL